MTSDKSISQRMMLVDRERDRETGVWSDLTHQLAPRGLGRVPGLSHCNFYISITFKENQTIL